MPLVGLSVRIIRWERRSDQLYRQLDGKVDHDSRVKRVLGLAAVLLAIASELGAGLSMQALGIGLGRTCLRNGSLSRLHCLRLRRGGG